MERGGEETNIDLDPSLVPLQNRDGVQLPPAWPSPTGAVRSIDGLLGPDILLAVGAANKGLSVSKVSAGNLITFSISGVTTAIRESSGPTTLDIGAVADGQALVRSGTSIIGTASPAFTGLTLSGLTAGSILFAGVGGVISQDNAVFFFNNTTNSIGLGTTSPLSGAFDKQLLTIATTTLGENAGLSILGNRSGANQATGGIAFHNQQSTTAGKTIAEILAGTPNSYDAEAGVIRFLTTDTAGTLTDRLRIDELGNISIGTATLGTSAAKVLAIFTGTAPSTGPADTVQFYSSDDSAGNTVPSFFCEGSGVVATGQADSVSSVRVKMRINGTVRTFLCI